MNCLQPFFDADKRWLVVVAHYDDEALFCGGALLQAAAAECALTIAVVTDARFTNRPKKRERLKDEPKRCRNRRAAFSRVCERLNASEAHLHYPQGDFINKPLSFAAELATDLQKRMEGWRPDVIVTHGPVGEYGHAQHVLTSQAVRSVHPSVPTFGFALHSECTIKINRQRKIELLNHYRYGGHSTKEWAPWRKNYKQWVTDYEHFLPLTPLASFGQSQ